MSHLTEPELHRLNLMADDVLEDFEHESYRIEEAVAMHDAFDEGGPRSLLARKIIGASIGRSCGRHGLDFRPINGDGREVRSGSDAGRIRCLRLRRARRLASGDYVVKVSSESALAVDEGSLFAEESWVLGYTLDSACTKIEEIFAGFIMNVRPGKPGRIEFGQIVMLGTGDGGHGGRFVSPDEDLPPFPGSDADDDDGFGFGLVS